MSKSPPNLQVQGNSNEETLISGYPKLRTFDSLEVPSGMQVALQKQTPSP